MLHMKKEWNGSISLEDMEFKDGHYPHTRTKKHWLVVKMGAIDYDKAKEMAKPYINAINEKSKEIAKKHGVKPRLVGFHNFVR